MKLQEIGKQLGLWLVLAAMAALSPSSPAYAWGATGHEFISGIAAELFPDEIPEFLRTPEAVATIAVFGREPDRDKHTGETHDSDLNPMHYVKLADNGNVAGVLPLDQLPITLDEYNAKLLAGRQQPVQVGLSSLRDRRRLVSARQGFRLLAGLVDRRQDGGRGARSRLVRRGPRAPRAAPPAGSRLLEPLSRRRQHAVAHFRALLRLGALSQPGGYATGDAMELYVKGTFVRRNINRDVVKSRVPPYDACNCTIWDRARKLILASNKEVVPMYELDKKGAFKAAAPEAIALVSAELSLGAARFATWSSMPGRMSSIWKSATLSSACATSCRASTS